LLKKAIVMSVKIPEHVQQRLADILHAMEETSELTRCVVVTRTGIKIAPDMDADSYSASSAALIDLGERVVASLEHGTLEELVINAIGGYVILAAVGKEYMLLGATSAGLKMGYYLPYVRKKAWDLENIIYGSTSPGPAAGGSAPRAKGQDVSRPSIQTPEVPERRAGSVR
jgi:predicted regulator of Ras-like GTPase activity (Roadblock/LC7/MglB family)